MKIKKLLLKMSVIVGILSITSMPALAANYRSYDKVLVKKSVRLYFGRVGKADYRFCI